VSHRKILVPIREAPLVLCSPCPKHVFLKPAVSSLAFDAVIKMSLRPPFTIGVFVLPHRMVPINSHLKRRFVLMASFLILGAVCSSHPAPPHFIPARTSNGPTSFFFFMNGFVLSPPLVLLKVTFLSPFRNESEYQLAQRFSLASVRVCCCCCAAAVCLWRKLRMSDGPRSQASSHPEFFLDSLISSWVTNSSCPFIFPFRRAPGLVQSCFFFFFFF